MTTHFLLGAAVVANLPSLHRRFGLSAVTKAGSLALGLGVCGWSAAAEPYQLFAATILSGAGSASLGTAAINAMVSPWFVRSRPAALALAYNGASVGGIVFSPLWVTLIAALGFPSAALLVAVILAATVWLLCNHYLARQPSELGLQPDGDAADVPRSAATSGRARPLPGRSLWTDARFVTLAAGMALGLFAQIGLIAHLFSLLVPALGAQLRGLPWACDGVRDRRTHACRLVHAHRSGSQAGRGSELRAPDRGLPRLRGGSRAARLPSAPRRRAVRARHRQCHLLAAADRPGRVREGRRAARRGPHHGDGSGDLRLAPTAFGLVREQSGTPGAAMADVPLFFLFAAVFQAAAIESFLVGRTLGRGALPRGFIAPRRREEEPTPLASVQESREQSDRRCGPKRARRGAALHRGPAARELHETPRN
jgi:hypothetical protein